MTISDIVAKIYKNTKTTAAQYPAANMLIDINNAYERVASLILKADTKWQWDDSNQLDLPVARTAVVNGQQDYSFAATHLKVSQARIKDTNGHWRILTPLDEGDEEYSDRSQDTVNGVPTSYDKRGASLFLIPTPNYSQDESLEITFQRAPVLFTSSEVAAGSKRPGFNSLYHELIPLWVSFDFWLPNDPNVAKNYLTKIVLLEESITKDYNMRSKDEKRGLRVRVESNK